MPSWLEYATLYITAELIPVQKCLVIVQSQHQVRRKRGQALQDEQKDNKEVRVDLYIIINGY